MRRPIAILAVFALAAAALAGFTAIASSATSKPATVKTGTSALGRIVVDGQFVAQAPRPRCSGRPSALTARRR